SPYTPEEVVSRNYILEEHPDVIINIVDATNLERNLYLTTQLIETDIPVVIALNMMDVVEKNGDKIDKKALESLMGVPVVEISALKNKNLAALMKTAYETAGKGKGGRSVIEQSGVLGGVYKEIVGLYGDAGCGDKVFHAVKMLEADEIETAKFPEIAKKAAGLKSKINAKAFDDDFEAMVADARYRFLTQHISSVISRAAREETTRSDRADRVLTHRIWGIPLFLLIIFAVFHITFAEDFLFLNGLFGVSVTDPGWINFFSGMGYEGMLEEAAGGVVSMAVPSVGVWLQSWMGWLTGSIIDVVSGWMSASPAWLSGLVCDGLLSGLDAIFSFLPQILLLFLFLSILEDSGYMARVAFIMDRAFRKFGLSGKAFMPLLMCFGCGVPGVMATKTLENEKERRMTMMIAPFFSCGAKLPIWLAFAGVLFAGQYGDLVVFSVYLIGIVVAIVAAIILRFTVFKGETPPFIMELPSYHLPQFKNLMAHLWEKLKHFIIKAGTIIAASIVVIWFLSNFDFAFWNGMVDNIEYSMMGRIGNVIKYLFYPLGFAMGADGWKFVVASLTGLLAKEEVVATLEVLSGGLGLEALLGGMTVASAYSFMLFNLLAVPCMAMVAAVYGEIGSGKRTWGAIGFWLLTAYVVSMVTYWSVSYWWIGVIILVAIVAALTVLYIRHKNNNKFKGVAA
ncbi:MAG TPA: ferrous iron transport protein B, partial [Firmicutes bacterium]|nr:ferrous iron transport protein B [Bacillota bacterium]